MTQEQIQRELGEQFLREALGKFKPTKSELDSYVFIDRKGKRVPTETRQQGYLVYVSPSGKKAAVFKRGEYKFPKTVRSYHPANQKRPHRKALAKFYRSTHEFRSEQVSGELPWEQAKKKMASYLEDKVGQFQSKGEFMLDVSVTARVNGRAQTYNTTISYAERMNQTIPGSVYKHFVDAKLYHFMAESLAEHGLVSEGSAYFIQNLEQNQDEEDPENWTDQKGKPWSGRNRKIVKIERIEWKVRKVTIRRKGDTQNESDD